MSAGAQVAVLPSGSRRGARSRQEAPSPAERPLVRLGAFSALALYGVLRWGTLLSPAPGWRLFGLLALAVIVAGAGPRIGKHGRAGAVIAALAAILGAFILSGIPLAWIIHARIALSASAIGDGLSSLPSVLVPYTGINLSVRLVLVLGAAVLLLDAALLLAFAPRPPGDLRRMGAALPLVALAVVPSTLVRPQLPFLQGLVLFGLLAAFIWGERLRRRDAGAAAAVAGLAGAAAMLVAPSLDRHKPWLDYEALAGALAPANVEAFDWSQHYGPLNWPRTGREVVDVKAQHPDYWKAEDLDVFDGRGWTQGLVSNGAQEPQPDPGAVQKWTQTLQVTIRGVRTTDVIAAGDASPPSDIAEGVVRGLSPGTWTAGADLVPGDSYLVATYSPHPSASELASDGQDYPDQPLAGYRSILLPQTPVSDVPPEIVFPQFHSGLPVESLVALYGANGEALLRASPYAQAFALAERLARQAPTPYAYVISVERLLSSSSGFRYDENPPSRAYPLAAFLFEDRLGYCQHFAGAMALLLRMGGIPARVATGFTTGSYDNATHRWVVSDQDAHAWVEVWFPHYGWVRFDPTPAAAPARGGSAPLPALRGRGTAPTPAPPVKRNAAAQAPPTRTVSRRGGSSAAAIVIPALVVVLLVVTLTLRVGRRTAEPSSDELLAELERALARCGRPIGDGVTLAALEQRFRSSPAAAAYVRAIRLARFGDATELPTGAQRRALRAQLRAGLGLAGFLRSLWALPPRRARAENESARRVMGLHSK